MRARALAVAAAAAATLATAQAAEAAKPAQVTTSASDQQQLANSRRLTIQVHYGSVGKVRLFGRLGRSGRPTGRSRRRRFLRPGTPLLTARLLEFTHPGTKKVTLPITSQAARLLAAQLGACRGADVDLYARARHYRRRHGLPLFSGRNRSHKSRTTRKSKGLPASCPSRTVSGPGGAGSGGGAGGGGAAGGGGTGGGVSSTIRAGAGSSDITPPVGTPMFAFTSRSGLDPGNFPNKQLQIVADPDKNLYAKSFERSLGIHTRVRARAIVIEQAGQKFALVQTDLGGLPYALVQEVLKRVQATGITGDRLLLSATHTHSSTGPIWPNDSQGYAALGGDAFDPRIFDLTAEGIAEAIRTANSHLEPARLGTGEAMVRNASGNRSYEAFQLDADVPKTEPERTNASIDPRLTVLRVDATDGRPIAVWSNFAVHPTSFGAGNLLFSGDNPATAERDSESAITRDASGRGVAPPTDRPVVDVWTNANEGDIAPNGSPEKDGNDNLQYVPNSFAGANMAGKKVAGGILEAWRDAGGHMGEPKVDSRRTFMAFDGTQAEGEPVGPLAVLGFGVIQDPTCSPTGDNPPLAGPGQGKKMPALGGPGNPVASLVPGTVPVSVWRVGGLGIVAFPAEITKQQGLRIRNALATASGGALGSFALAGLTNGYVSYTATPEEYDYCGYEGGFTLYGRRQGPRYLAVAQSVLGALLGGGQAPSALEPPGVAPAGGSSPVDQTPDAGQIDTQPASSIKRYGRAVFKWHGGDPAVDAPRNKAFVSVQHQDGNGDWQTVGTEDGYFDTTEFDHNSRIWTETWQFTECSPTGTYRFKVTGVADKGSGPAPYQVTSNSFQVTPTDPLQPGAVNLAGNTASVLARYPDPGGSILTALPRRVRSGFATLHVMPSDKDVQADSDGLVFTATVPAGTTSATVKHLEDACGNAAP